ncbi:MAG: response regulator [Ktedonobacterales bacterium]|nr:response regulator [Ktedonobacterales bacterium]
MVRVLIVDDDQAIRETLRFLLEDAGHHVAEAADGLAALNDLRRTEDRTVVLLDLMMPKLDGAGVLGAVAGDRRLSSQHAYALVTATHQTLSLAFMNLLSSLSVPMVRKPFDIDALLDLVERMADRLN